MNDPVNLALFVVRVAFGVGLAAHGYNKVFGGGGLAGTGRWFGSVGMKWPALQARMAAATELGAGLLFVAGLITPIAAAGMVSVMAVATWTVHRKNGFFIFKDGWEYTVAIAIVAWAVGTIGPGEWSLDNAFDISFNGWSGALIAGLVGVGGAIAQIAICYRPASVSQSKAS